MQRRRILVVDDERSNDGSGGGIEYQLNRITAPGSGGTAITPAKFNQSDPASDATVVWRATTAPTRDSVYIDAGPIIVGQLALQWEWAPSFVVSDAKNYELRPNQAEGFEVQYIPFVAPTSAPQVMVTFEWVEF